MVGNTSFCLLRYVYSTSNGYKNMFYKNNTSLHLKINIYKLNKNMETDYC